MQSRKAAFSALAVGLYRRGIRSHHLTELSKFVGENMSSKTILAKARLAGIVQPNRILVGKWSKRKMPIRHYEHGLRWFIKRGLSPALRMRWPRKNKILSLPLKAVGMLFARWYSYSTATGNFDLAALLNGDEPP